MPRYSPVEDDIIRQVYPDLGPTETAKRLVREGHIDRDPKTVAAHASGKLKLKFHGRRERRALAAVPDTEAVESTLRILHGFAVAIEDQAQAFSQLIQVAESHKAELHRQAKRIDEHLEKLREQLTHDPAPDQDREVA